MRPYQILASERDLIIKYCIEHIGLQRHYLHSSIAGEGWRVYFDPKTRYWYVSVSDDDAIMLGLQYTLYT